MTKTEAAVRSIFGITRTDIRPLICAVDVAIELMFIKGVPMDDILVTSAKVASTASKALKQKSTGKATKTLAGSALSNRRKK